jgi:hypothetical protein
VKATKKLEIKKVTLQDLDEPKLDAMAGGVSFDGQIWTCNICGTKLPTVCPNTCNGDTCFR